jgi:hypothetical protein
MRMNMLQSMGFADEYLHKSIANPLIQGVDALLKRNF